MKVVVLGASGLLGYACVQSLAARGCKVTAVYGSLDPGFDSRVESRRMDLSDLDGLRMFLLNHFPDAVVNAAAIAVPAAVDVDPESAQRMNVYMPQSIAELVHHVSGRFIHISTDMVFDGKKGDYQTSDMPNPVNRYGKQKLEAEKAVLAAAAESSVVLRVPLLTGNSLRGNRSLHENLFRQWASGQVPQLFTDEMRSPCSVENLAEVVTELCERSNLSGIFHWSGKETISRYAMGKAILEFFNLPEDLIAATTVDAVYPNGGRQKNLSMLSSPLSGKLKTQQQTFADQLEEMIVPLAYREWYHSL